VDVLEAGFGDIAGRIKLALEGLAGGVGESVAGGSFTTSGHIEVTHLDIVGVGFERLGKGGFNKG